MRCETVTHRRGFTITELMVAMTIAPIVTLCMWVLVADSHRGWNKTYNRVYGDVIADGYVAQKTFDAVVRKSSIKREFLGDGEVEVYYYSDIENPISLDRYARFYVADERLMVDYGELDEGGIPQDSSSTVTLARNVQAAQFTLAGTSVQMILSLDDGSQSLTVASTAVRHNE